MTAPGFDDDELNRVNDRILAAKRLLGSQDDAAKIEAEICDIIRAERKNIPGLDNQIRQLEIHAPVVYNYLQRLEFLGQGIWCPTCKKMKTVAPPEKQVDQLALAVAELENTRRIFDRKIGETRKKIDNLLADISAKKISSNDILS